MAAAVADYRPAQTRDAQDQERRRPAQIALAENPDLLAGLAERAPAAVRVGFAAETDDVEANATAKLARKRVDFLVANDVSRSDIGFASEHNEVVVYRRDGAPVRLDRAAEVGASRAACFDLFTPSLRRPRAQTQRHPQRPRGARIAGAR